MSRALAFVSATMVTAESNEIVVPITDVDKEKIEEILAQQSGVKVYWAQVVDTKSLAGNLTFSATLKIYANLTIAED
jgi:hypothetical protein